MLAVIATSILVVVAFVFVGLPDILGIVREDIFAPAVRNGTPEAAIVSRLNAIHADWHYGTTFQQGEAGGSFDFPIPYCQKHRCTNVIQAQFITWLGMCIEGSDVISMRFDTSGRLARWRKYGAVDGC